MTKFNLVAEPGKQEIVITRVYDAPRDLVFKTVTNPKLIPRWWGPKRYTTTVDKMEVRPGGVWRFIQRGTDGRGFAFRGVYHSATSPEALVYTFEFEEMPGHVLLETVTFEEQDGRTKMTVRDVFQTVEDRDGMLKSGMEEGASETTDRFAKLLKVLRKNSAEETD